MNAKRFFDPLYGRIPFDEWEAQLIFAPEVQRLRYIRMCNINSLLVSGASEICRFEHVVGVFHLAKQWTRQNAVVGEDAKVIHAAALLHDIQTGPFGHSLEYILDDNELPGDFRHEDLSHGLGQRYLQLTNANVAFAGARFAAREILGGLWPRVAETIAGRGPFGPLISSRVDIDNIDNVVRLGFHAGVADKGDAKVCTSLVQDIRIVDGLISISRTGVQLLHRWQEIRRELYKLLLHDWAEFSAKAMLTKLMELAVEAGLLGADSWLLTDDGLLSIVTRESVGESQQIGELARKLLQGNLYTPLGLWRNASVERYDTISRLEYKRELERRISAIIGSKCIFHVILDNGKTERKLNLLLRDDGRIHEFGHQTRELLIGLFLSRADQSTVLKAKALNELRCVLTSELGELLDLEDPVPIEEADVPRQLSLL